MVDDNPGVVESFARGLRLRGYKVDTRESAEKALDLFEQNPFQYDALVLDLSMPVEQATVDRFHEAIRKDAQKLREDLRNHSCGTFMHRQFRQMGHAIPVVILTNYFAELGSVVFDDDLLQILEKSMSPGELGATIFNMHTRFSRSRR